MAQLDAILSQGGQPVEELVKFENPRFGKERLHLPVLIGQTGFGNKVIAIHRFYDPWDSYMVLDV